MAKTSSNVMISDFKANCHTMVLKIFSIFAFVNIK